MLGLTGMKHMISSAAVFASLAFGCSSGSDAKPCPTDLPLVATSCRTPKGTCEKVACIDGAWSCPAGDTTLFGLEANSCGAVDGDGGTDGASCPVDVPGIATSCKKADGTCEPVACIDGAWSCPAGDTVLTGTAANTCGAADAGPFDALSGDAACGARPLGSTCQLPQGGCESLVCIGGTWTCPAGDLEVALTPSSCVADAGPQPPVDVGGCGAPVATAIPLADGGTVTCYCEGACGCFLDPDAGTRCP